MPAPTPPTPQVKTSTLWVQRTFPEGETFEEQNIEVHLFESQPAEVYAQAGRTISTAPYESMRIEVGVRLPCYPEEVPKGLERASEIVGVFLQQEEAAIRAAIGVTNAQQKF